MLPSIYINIWVVFKRIFLCYINISPGCRLFIQNYFILSYHLSGSGSFNNYRNADLLHLQLTESNLSVCLPVASYCLSWAFKIYQVGGKGSYNFAGPVLSLTEGCFCGGSCFFIVVLVGSCIRRIRFRCHELWRPPKAASLQAMLADFFVDNCGYF
jgi:hypothetical protein